MIERPDPEWEEPCREHPGHENHCLSGYCGSCWLCNMRGVDSKQVEAYSRGVASGLRRATATASEIILPPIPEYIEGSGMTDEAHWKFWSALWNGIHYMLDQVKR